MPPRDASAGFTLIELMIVVAIVGILAAIAIPTYNRYVGKSQMTEAFRLAGGAKNDMVLYYADGGSCAGITNNADVGIANATSINGAYVAGVWAGTGCTITARLKGVGSANGGIADTKLRLTPGVYRNGTFDELPSTGDKAVIDWRCTSTAPAAYLPDACEHADSL